MWRNGFWSVAVACTSKASPKRELPPGYMAACALVKLLTLTGLIKPCLLCLHFRVRFQLPRPPPCSLLMALPQQRPFLSLRWPWGSFIWLSNDLPPFQEPCQRSREILSISLARPNPSRFYPKHSLMRTAAVSIFEFPLRNLIWFSVRLLLLCDAEVIWSVPPQKLHLSISFICHSQAGSQTVCCRWCGITQDQMVTMIVHT